MQDHRTVAGRLTRPDKKLPPRLRHDAIHEVHDVSSNGTWAFHIVFDQESLPVGYTQSLGDGWEIRDASLKRRNTGDGLLSYLRGPEPCISVLVVLPANESDANLLHGDP